MGDLSRGFFLYILFPKKLTMSVRIGHIIKITEQIRKADPSMEPGVAFKLAIEVDRNEILDEWLEKISQALHRIDEGIDRLKED